MGVLHPTPLRSSLLLCDDLRSAVQGLCRRQCNQRNPLGAALSMNGRYLVGGMVSLVWRIFRQAAVARARWHPSQPSEVLGVASTRRHTVFDTACMVELVYKYQPDRVGERRQSGQSWHALCKMERGSTFSGIPLALAGSSSSAVANGRFSWPAETR